MGNISIIQRIWAFLKEPFIKQPVPIIPVAVSTPQPVPPNPISQVSPRETLYFVSKGCIGIDASPNDIAPDEFGCAETVWDVINRAFPGNVGFPLTLSTVPLYNGLSRSSLYEEVASPLPGDIILCVSGTGNGTLPHGHTGIVAMYGIISNDSATGLFKENYTMASWFRRYAVTGGFKIHYFRRISH